MTEKELMLAEKLYLATDKNLLKDRARAKELCRLINNTGESQIEYRQGLFRELLTRTGNNFWIEPPFYADYGYNIYLGDNFYANYDCIILDIAKVEIGSNVLFGPRVCIFTASHPIDANIRNMQLEFGKSVSIADNVWIGGNTVINPGVKIGNNSIIGSGSVVTKNIPNYVIAAGNPCRVIRSITEEDKIYWEREKEIYHKNRSS